MNTSKSSKKLEAFRNAEFQSNRIFREVTGTILGSPEQVFPLLCSMREIDWLPGSNHTTIYTDTGYAEKNYIFMSDFFGFGMETWVRFKHIENSSLAYVRTSENLVLIFDIELKQLENEFTCMKIQATFTALNDKGNTMIDAIPEQLPFEGIISALNHYITTGEMIGTQKS